MCCGGVTLEVSVVTARIYHNGQHPVVGKGILRPPNALRRGWVTGHRGAYDLVKQMRQQSGQPQRAIVVTSTRCNAKRFKLMLQE